MTNSGQSWKHRAILNQKWLYKILVTTHRAVCQGRPEGASTGWVVWCDCGWSTIADIEDAEYLAIEHSLSFTKRKEEGV